MIDIIRVRVVDPLQLPFKNEAVEVDLKGNETGRRFQIGSFPKSLFFDWFKVNAAYVGDNGKVNIILL